MIALAVVAKVQMVWVTTVVGIAVAVAVAAPVFMKPGT